MSKKISNPSPEEIGAIKPPAPPAPPRIVEGTWAKNCVQRAFVEGAKWWQFHHNGSTMFGSERDEAEAEAIRRYGDV